MGSSRRSILAIFACAVSLLLAVLSALSLGAVCLSLAELSYGLKEIDSPAGRILLYVRVPHLLTVTLAEVGLLMSGVLIQAVLQDPLVSPGIIGADAGAGLAAVLYMVLLSDVVPALPLTALLGALISVLLAYGITRRAEASCITLMLSGVVLSSLMTAGINTLVIMFPDITVGLRDFQNGGSESVPTGILWSAGLVTLLGLLVSLLLAGELDVLDLREITASSLGLLVWFYHFLFLALATVPTGAAVSLVGPFGFVGLIVPHMARFLLKGSGKWSFLLLSTLLGAVLLILCGTAAQTVSAPFKPPVGILTVYLGVPSFLWLLFRGRRERHD